MTFKLMLFEFLVCLTLTGQADTQIKLPSLPPQPAPAPAPGSRPLLTGDGLYVVDCKVDVVARAHPAGLVKITKEAGPLRIRGRFVDSDGKVQTRTYAGPTVLIVEAVGKGTVELDFIPIGFKAESEIVTATIDVDAGQGPQPPPGPNPPDPKPPEPVKSFRVIMVYESGDTLTAAQQGVIFGKTVEDFLTAKCTGGKSGWRRRDKDAPGESDPTFKVLWAAVQPKVTSVPCVAVAVNERVEIIPLEKTPAEMVAKLKTYLGEK